MTAFAGFLLYQFYSFLASFLLTLFLYPVKSAKGGLPHSESNLAANASLWKANGDYSSSHVIAFANCPMRLLTSEYSMFLIICYEVIHYLRNVDKSIFRPNANECTEIRNLHYLTLDNFVNFWKEGQKLKFGFVIG